MVWELHRGNNVRLLGLLASTQSWLLFLGRVSRFEEEVAAVRMRDFL